ncbi:pentatricopeptide repeat-containing protein At1g33350 [Primulina eburnea]|uniref:pentatricopeptide repeat-containing protein At1g33350 n=1 Tax=Primulina eburnea TaxID=1245227 RepID=UPI003C6C8566
MLSSLNRHVLSILDNCSNLNHLKQLQAHLTVLGHGQTHFYAFKLIRFCTLHLSNLGYARLLFDKFNSPNIYLYAAMITAYAPLSDHASAVLLYRRMLRENRSKPNDFVFSIILKSYPAVLKRHGTELVQAQVVKSGYGETPAVQTAILDAYSRYCVDIGAARKVFDEMSDRSVMSWTAMLSGYTRVGLVGNAVLLFDEMPEGIRDTPFWNSIISGCVQNGLFSEAIEFFRRMIVEEGSAGRNKPNQVTVVSVLSASGKAGLLHLGKCIHGYVCRNGLSLDLFVTNGLIDMYGKCGNYGKARMVFNNTKETNLMSWNSLINCCWLHGQIGESISIFEEMLQRTDEVKPDGVTFIGLLNACSHGGLVVEGLYYYDMMIHEYGIEPQIEHHGCLIDLLCRAGRIKEAVQVVEGMRIPPDEVVCGAMLNGCKIHRCADFADYAVKNLIEINPKNFGHGAILANLCLEMEERDEVQEGKKMPREYTYKDAPGCSWIEVKNQVHHFYCVDKSHPRTEQIYAVLECLADSP